MTYNLVYDFADLFAGRRDVRGRGKSGTGPMVRHQDVSIDDYFEHLEGRGSGLGIFPLRDNGTVSFAAIDLDRPDFDLARSMQAMLPGTTWIERSTSGNAHLWAFFDSPVPAWIPRGLMRAVVAAAGDERVEVFPKQANLLPGMVGNYINLPYFGNDRPILADWAIPDNPVEYRIDAWVPLAMATRNTASDWEARARALGIGPEQAITSKSDFGSMPMLHECALHIIERARSGEKPIDTNRHVVFFHLAKQLLMWEQMEEDTALGILEELNELSPDPLPRQELRRIFDNASSGRWTSLGCDDPLMAEYVSPTCPIAHPH